MQNNTDETPRIIALSVAIVAVVVFVIYRIVAVTQAPVSPATGASTATSAVRVASTAVPGSSTTVTDSSEAPVPGQARLPRPGLDDETPGANPPPPAGNPFKTLKEPVVSPLGLPGALQPLPGLGRPATGPRGLRPSTATPGPSIGPPSGLPGIMAPGYMAASPLPQTIYRAAPPVHTEAFRVEGVVTGPDGFAMISQGDQTLFKRVRDYVAGYRIVRLGSSGITLRRNRRIVSWSVGEEVHVIVPGATSTSAAAAQSAAPLSSPNGVPAAPHMEVPAPQSGPTGAPTLAP